MVKFSVDMVGAMRIGEDGFRIFSRAERRSRSNGDQLEAGTSEQRTLESGDETASGPNTTLHFSLFSLPNETTCSL